MCQFVGIAPYGTDAFLRNRLRQHLAQIKHDDYEIEQEGWYGMRDTERHGHLSSLNFMSWSCALGRAILVPQYSYNPWGCTTSLPFSCACHAPADGCSSQWSLLPASPLLPSPALRGVASPISLATPYLTLTQPANQSLP
jgi:hypothetical protein